MKQHWFVFCRTDLLLVSQPDGTLTIPLSEQPPVATAPWTKIHQLTMPDGEVVKTMRVEQQTVPSELQDVATWCGLRASYQKLPRDLYLKAGKCQEILYWDENTRYCGVCGAPMELHTEISKRCTHCGKEVWPQLATAVIVLIHKGEEALLVRGRNFVANFYGLVAGFVETGETLEEAVARETLEETGLTITNIRYFGSQPWPYPCGLMVGFEADYVSGEIHVQLSELKRAAWFCRDNLPRIPEKLSIARQLIDHWLEG